MVSFSPVLNAMFHGYLNEMRLLLETADGRRNVGKAVNESVGKYLPRLLKNSNHHHLASLTDQEYAQISLYIEHVIMLDANRYVERCSSINIPLLFVNGSLDRYAAPEETRTMEKYVPGSKFVVIEGAGHFLELESREARAATRATFLEFLGVPVVPTLAVPQA